MRGYSLLYDVRLSNKSCRYLCGCQIWLPKAAAIVCDEVLCSGNGQGVPVGNSECTPHVALVACAALALASQLF